MKKINTFKKILTSASIAFCMFCGFLATPTAMIYKTFADYIPVNVEISNGDFNSNNDFTEVNDYDIVLPSGWTKADDAIYQDQLTVKLEGDEDKKLIISSSENRKFGIKQSNSTTFLKESYYLIEMDIKTEGITGLNGASIYLSGDKEFKLAEAIRTDGAEKHYKFYFETNSALDKTLSIELWFGSKNEGVTGKVYFDNVKITKISPTEYLTRQIKTLQLLENDNFFVSDKVDVTPNGIDKTSLFNYTKTPLSSGMWTLKDASLSSDIIFELVEEKDVFIEYLNQYKGSTSPTKMSENYFIQNYSLGGSNYTKLYIDTINNKAYFDYDNSNFTNEVPLKLDVKYYNVSDQEIYLNPDDNKFYLDKNFTTLTEYSYKKYFITHYNVNKTDTITSELIFISDNQYYVNYENGISVFNRGIEGEETFFTSTKIHNQTFPYNDGFNGNYNRILKLQNKNTEQNATVVSPKFTLEQFTNYKISIYAKTNQYLDDTTSSIEFKLVATQKTGAFPDGIDKDISITATPYSTTTDITDNWINYTFYIKGSPISSQDATLQFEISKNSTVYISNIEFTRIDTDGLTNVNNLLDLTKDKDSNSLIKSDTVTNGNFNIFTDVKYDGYGKTIFPIEPSNFTKVGELKGSNSTSGIIPTNNLYDTYIKSIVGDENKPFSNNLNVLAIYASSLENFGYKSSKFKLSASNYYKITFDVYTGDNFNGEVYSTLYLGSSAISEFDKITSEGKWTTYTYYVHTNDLENEMYLEIGIKNATGTCFIKELNFNKIDDEADFNNKLYKLEDNKETIINLATQKAENYCIIDMDLDSFTSHTYSYSDTTNKLYNSFTYSANTASTGIIGILDTDDVLTGTIFEGKTKLNLPGSKSNSILVLHNADNLKFSEISQVFGRSLKENTYYKISIFVKTENIEETQGLKITIMETGKELSEDPFTINFTQINTTSYKNNDTNDYKEYVAYIKTGSTAPNALSLTATLGTSENGVLGTAYIGAINYSTVTKKDFNNAQKLNKINNGDAQFYNLSDANSKNNIAKPNNTNGWTIFFVVFSSLALVGSLVIVIIVLSVRKLPKTKKTFTKTVKNNKGETRQKGGFV